MPRLTTAIRNVANQQQKRLQGFAKYKSGSEAEYLKDIEDHELFNLGSHAQRAHQVIKELYQQYCKRSMRIRGYQKLLRYMLFMLLYLTMIYLQRDASNGHRVHSTIYNNMMPYYAGYVKPPQTVPEIYDYLEEQVAKYWRDPICGNTVCEAPFEFPSYARFGCTADCGFLSEAQELQEIQIDLTWDFTHTLGGLPANSLLQDATWNLCPVTIAPHGTECYYAEDRAFPNLSGSASYEIKDLPAGEWEVVVKRDYFYKVAGAVRDKKFMDLQGNNYTKIDAAYKVATAGLTYEDQQLTIAMDLATDDLAALVKEAIVEDAATLTAAAQASWNDTATFPTAAAYEAKLLEIERDKASMLQNVDRRGAAECATNLRKFDLSPVYDASNVTLIPGRVFWDATFGAGAPLHTNITTAKADGSMCSRTTNGVACECGRIEDYASSVSLARGLGVLTALRNRIAKQTTPKVIGRQPVMDATRQQYQLNLLKTAPALVKYTFNAATGLDALNAPYEASMAELEKLYFKGPDAYGPSRTSDNPADGNLATAQLDALTPTSVDSQDALETKIASMTRLAAARAAEITGIRQAVLARAEVRKVTALPSVFIHEYNIVKWEGGKNAYLWCNLEDRGHDVYAGTCVPATRYVAPRPSPEQEYTCLQESDGTVLKGERCTRQVDLQKDCTALCECKRFVGTANSTLVRGCAGTSETDGEGTAYCTCSLCEALPAADNTNVWAQIEAEAEVASRRNLRGFRRLRERMGARSEAMLERSQRRRLAAFEVGGDRAAAGGRALKQSSDSDRYALLQDNVDTLANVQDQLGIQVKSLEAEVMEARIAAQQPGKDLELQELIQTSNREIHEAFEAEHEVLESIKSKQQQVVATLERQSAAIASLATMASNLAATIERIEKSSTDVMTALKMVVSQQSLTLAEVLEVWKTSRRRNLEQEKSASLSNTPCTAAQGKVQQMQRHEFATTSNDTTDYSLEVRSRTIGTTNRILGGMLVHVTRGGSRTCKETRFSYLTPDCSQELTVDPYGTDPVFKSTSSIYNGDLDDPKTILQFYNCDEALPQGKPAVYNITSSSSYYHDMVTNPEPYCANLYSPSSNPWAFHHVPLEQHDPGFPLWIDVQYDAQQATDLVTYAKEALLLDEDTKMVTSEIVTYNPLMRMFGKGLLRFTVDKGGKVGTTFRMHVIRVELYINSTDIFRLALEVIVTLALVYMALAEAFLHFVYPRFRKEKPRPTDLADITGVWKVLELMSTLLMLTLMIVWWLHVFVFIRKFTMNTMYEVYADLSAQAYKNKLADAHGSGLQAAVGHMNDLEGLINTMNWYFSMHSLNLMFQIAYVLRLLDFQPRLGIVTRSLKLAALDLGNFLAMLAIVILFYTTMGYIMFGNAVQQFSSFAYSLDTCFNMLMGDTSAGQAVRELMDPLRTVGGLYFWSFMLLVFMLLLNFVLAIICDAFCEVKEATSESVGLWEEISHLLGDWFLHITRQHKVSTDELGRLLAAWADESDEKEAASAAPEEDESAVAQELEAHEPLAVSDVYEILRTRSCLIGEDRMDEMLPARAQHAADTSTEVDSRLHYIAGWLHERLKPMRPKDTRIHDGEASAEVARKAMLYLERALEEMKACEAGFEQERAVLDRVKTTLLMQSARQAQTPADPPSRVTSANKPGVKFA